MTDLLLTNTAFAYVNYGRWVVNCSHPYCDAAVEFNALKPPFYATFTPATVCWECGGRTQVVWPAEEMVYGIERLLLLRRNRKYQNWLPGETLVDLQRENGEHGVFNFLNPEDWSPGELLMGATEIAITMDELPMLNPRRELKAVDQ